MEGRLPTTVNLEGRRVLIISPRFFGYERRIVERLEFRGAKAVLVDDRPSNGTLSKALIRMSSSLMRPRLDAYHRSVIQRLLGESFDDILFVVPESCSTATIRRYREAFVGARVLLYMWDSFENKTRRDVRGFLKLFDRAFSFDGVDCDKYGMSFRPLFFTETPDPSTEEPVDTFGFSFIGTIHSDRYKILTALKSHADKASVRYFIYPFLPSRLHYWLYKFTKWEFRGTHQSDLRFNPLPYTEVLRVMRDSVAVVDIEHPDQRGLTMRTLEVIGAGKKLITTNRNVLQYPFYSPERIQVIDRRDPVIASDFLKTSVESLPPHLLAKYSLDGWIDDLFGQPALDSSQG